MKRLFTTLFALTLCFSLVFAQEKVKEKDIKGEWKMIIDIDMDEVEEDMEEDSWFGWAIAGAMSGLVEDVLEEIEIRIRFMDEGKLKITVDAFGDEEIEYGEWHINSKGQLVIIDDDRSSIDDDEEVWMMEGEHLVSYEIRSNGRLDRQEVYLKRM